MHHFLQLNSTAQSRRYIEYRITVSNIWFFSLCSSLFIQNFHVCLTYFMFTFKKSSTHILSLKPLWRIMHMYNSKYQSKQTFSFMWVRMHEGKCLSQIDKGKFTLLETLHNDDKWKRRKHFWSTLSDFTSSYIELIMFSVLFLDRSRLDYGQHVSSILFFEVSLILSGTQHWKTVLVHCFWYHHGFQYCNIQV